MRFARFELLIFLVSDMRMIAVAHILRLGISCIHTVENVADFSMKLAQLRREDNVVDCNRNRTMFSFACEDLRIR